MRLRLGENFPPDLDVLVGVAVGLDVDLVADGYSRPPSLDFFLSQLSLERLILAKSEKAILSALP